MKLKFSIAQKLIVGFGVLLFAVLLTSFMTYQNLDKNLVINRRIVKNHIPSEAYLTDLHSLITNSKMLIKSWVFISNKPGTDDKIELQEIHSIGYPNLIEKLEPLSENWDNRDLLLYSQISSNIDTLFRDYKQIMGMLQSFDDYDNMNITILAESYVDEYGRDTELADVILKDIEALRQKQSETVDAANVEMENSFASFQQLIVVMGVILLFAIILIAFILSRAMVVPINRIKKIIRQMGTGILPKVKHRDRTDEIGEMEEALQVLIEGLRKTSEFAIKIGEGNYKSSYQPLGKKDELGNSLLLMRQNLSTASEDAENRRLENAQRSWSAQGIAEFGELMRDSNDNLEEFSAKVLFKLVRYLKVNLGGMFIINDENPDDVFLELTAFYAYDRRKFESKRIEIGENLVGQCVQEKETTYLNDIPEDYVRIVSGLGKDLPKSLVVVPLKLNNIVYGAVELASFISLEKYQIEFIEKIGESIASSISSVKIKNHTAKLLDESNEKSERLVRQEEDVRKNIEELQHNQEEMLRQKEEEKKRNLKIREEYEKELASLTEKFYDQENEVILQKIVLENNMLAIENSIGKFEIDMEGKIITANKKYIAMTGIPLMNLVGKDLRRFMSKERINKNEFDDLLIDLSNGKNHRGGHQYFFDKQERWFYETFSPAKNEKGEFCKVIVLSNDISKIRTNEAEMQKKYDDLLDEFERLKLDFK